MISTRSRGPAVACAPEPVPPDDQAVPDARDWKTEIAVFLTVVAAPIVFSPFSWHPFIDAKLVVVATAALLFALRAQTFRSRLAIPVAVWFAAAAAATATGVDPVQSLLGRTDQGSGLALIGICGVILLGGTTVPPALRARVPSWIVGAGVAAAILGASALIWPDMVLRIFGRPIEPVFLSGLPPLGHPVFLGGFLSVAIAAAVPVALRRPVVAAAAVAVLASGIALTGKRGALIAAAAGLAVSIIRTRAPRRVAVSLCITLVAVVGLWSVIDATVRPDQPVSSARRFGEVLTGSAKARPYVWASSARALGQRPAFGWGPANTWGANMSVATQAEARATGRVWTDAHNIVVESFVTTGIVGGVALLGLLGLSLGRLRRGPPTAGWVAGGVLALVLHHGIQPVNVALTPLLFLLIGMAGVDPGAARIKNCGWFRGAAVAMLMVALPLSVLRLTASSVEAYGQRYSFTALRLAVRLDSSAISAAATFAKQSAIGARTDPVAERRVRNLVERLVAAHPWDPSVRLTAAEVELLLNRPDRAAMWLDRHLRRFPTDARAMAFRANVASRVGDDDVAQLWTSRSLSLDPNGPASQQSHSVPRSAADR